jgi:N-acetylglutamate synthase-like GNAT family acetyltransferase
MSEPTVTVRRATVEDLPALRALWGKAGFPAAELEKRFTEFQLVCSAEGALWGALGLQLEGKQACLHHLVVPDAAWRELVQQRLWERAITLAQNHGLTRLWVRAEDALGDALGFQLASGDVLGRLPPPFGSRDGGWRTLRLREETAESVSLDQEFELFQQAQREESRMTMQQARRYKTVALLLLAVFLGVVALLVLLTSLSPESGSGR